MRGNQIRESLIPSNQRTTHSVIKYKNRNHIMITRNQLPSHIGQWPWLNPNPQDISESKNRKVIVLAQDHKWYTRYTSQHRIIRLTGSRPMNPATHHQTTGRVREAIWGLQQMESIHKTVAKKSRKAEGRMKPS